MPEPGPPRADWLAGFRELGVARVQALLPAAVETDDALARLAEDALAAGARMVGRG